MIHTHISSFNVQLNITGSQHFDYSTATTRIVAYGLCVYIYIYIYIYVYVFICMYVCMYIYVYVYYK